ncbi:MAG: hypothetical protein HY683_00895 [Chloroflexi bacterium]|nr:hypothetical protein [Chloroflexota bacterium]
MQGFVGDKFAIAAEGLPPGKNVEFQWDGWEAAYVTQVIPDNVQYIERTYSKKRVPLGRAVSDAQGRVSVSFAAPEDHGEAHDIYAVVDGKDAAKGGFRIKRSVEVSSTKGAVGDLITITVKGMATSYYQSTMSVTWDNRYTGFISAVTTKGTGTAQIRAAGPPGDHIIQVYSASQATPYLNSHDNARNWYIFSHLPDQFVYTVTEDRGAPPVAIQWPDDSRVATVTLDTPTTTAGSPNRSSLIPSVVQPASGPVFSKATVRSSGLPANTDVDLVFVTARGNRTSGSGWVLDVLPLGKAKTGGNGSLEAAFEVPDDLGGWHTVRVMAGEKLLSETPFYMEPSLVQVTPRKVKAGERITVQLKGIGWTELDNGIAVTYDNSYIGYACGFSSNGTVNIYIPATGGKGTHLIDIYPMVYEGHPNKQVFNFQVPQLTALQDHPGLSIGYHLPIFRVAVEVE